MAFFVFLLIVIIAIFRKNVSCNLCFRVMLSFNNVFIPHMHFRDQKKDGLLNGKSEKISKTYSTKPYQTQKNRQNEYDRIDRNGDISDTDDDTNTSTCVGEKGKKMWNSYDHVTTRFDQLDQSQYAHIKIEFPNTPELQPLTDSSASNYFILEISDEKS